MEVLVELTVAVMTDSQLSLYFSDGKVTVTLLTENLYLLTNY